jgi:hypothetical protein
MAANLLAWTGAAVLIAWMGMLNSLPASANLGLGPAAMVCALAMAFILLGSFVLAAGVHLAAFLSGGEGGFDRSYLLLSLTSICAPIFCATLWSGVPFLWLAPTAYAFLLVGKGVSVWHKAPGGQVLVVVGFAALLVIAGQLLACHFASRLREPFEMMLALNPSAASPRADPGGFRSPPEAPPAASAAVPAAPAQAGDQVPAPPSGLDLVRRSQDLTSSIQSMQAEGRPLTAQDVQEVRSKSLGMLDELSRQLRENPELTKNMNPSQREQMQRLLGVVDQVRSQKRFGEEGVNPAQLLRQLTQALSGSENAPEPSRPQARPRRRNRTPAPDPGLP